MASPAFATESSGQGSGSSFTMTAPSGSADGDILYCQVLVETGHASFSAPSGWTDEFNAIDTSAFTVWIYTLRRAGAPSLGVSWSGTKYWEWMIGRFTGAVASGAYIDTKVAGTPGSYSTVDPPAVTTTTTDTLVICSTAHWAGYFSNAGPTNYTQFGVGVFINTKAAYRAIGAPATEDPGTFATPGSTDAAVSTTLAIRSQAAGAAATSDPIESGGRRQLRQNPVYRMTPGGIYAPVSYSFAP
jgi:hypothetical protein